MKNKHMTWPVYLILLFLLLSGCVFFSQAEPDGGAGSTGTKVNAPEGTNAGTERKVSVQYGENLVLLLQDMGNGINIGNSFDACDWKKGFLKAGEKDSLTETLWGNPQVDEQLIAMIANAGFRTVRLPVTWFNHMDPDGNVHPDFLERVETAVDLILKYDLYCIISIHHDTGNDGWIKASETNYYANKESVWNLVTQIAEYFEKKDERLILEGFNEIVNDANRWSRVPSSDLAVMNMWNQLFVDAVRRTGGNNASRYLLVNTYAALSDKAILEAFKLPEDTVEDRLLVGVHCYYNANNMEEGFRRLSGFIARYPIVIGEWGNKATDMDPEKRREYVGNFCSFARTLELPQIWWDNGKMTEWGIMNRAEHTWLDEELVSRLVK